MAVAQTMQKMSATISTVLVILTFVNLCSGLVTMAGIFVSDTTLNLCFDEANRC
jgi:hypothetical protein